MFGFSAFSQSPFSTLGGGASGPFVYNVSVSEATDVTATQDNVVTFLAALSEAIQVTEAQAYQLDILASQSEAIQAADVQDSARFIDGQMDEQFYAYPLPSATFTALADLAEAITNLDATQATTTTSPAYMVESITVADSIINDTHFDAHFDEGMLVAHSFNGIVTQYVDIAENITAENLEFPFSTAIAEQSENTQVTSSDVGGLLVDGQMDEAVELFYDLTNITTFVPSISETVNLLAATDSEFIILGEMSEAINVASECDGLGSNFQFMTEATNVTESSVAIGSFPAAISESISVSDVSTAVGEFITAIEENMAIIESFDGSIVWVLFSDEFANFSEAYQQNQGYDVNINEATTNTSVVAKSTEFVSAIAEAFDATSEQSDIVTFLSSVAEAINAFAFNDTSSDIRVNVDENFVAQDIFDQGYAYDLAVEEAISIAVDLIGIKYFNYYITDGVNVTSTTSALQIATGNMVDEIQSASFYGNLATYFDSINEFANIIQAVDGLGTFYVSLGDQISVTQSFGIQEKWIPADNTQNANWTDPSNEQVPNWTDPSNEQVPNWDPVNSI